MSGVFDYIGSINYKNKILKVDKEYSAFVVDKFFSFFIDTIHYANEANQLIKDNELHYKYLYHTVKKRNRKIKWIKREKDEEEEVISAYYNCSPEKAREYKEILTGEQLKYIKMIMLEKQGE